jgi:hypothetical protein
MQDSRINGNLKRKYRNSKEVAGWWLLVAGESRDFASNQKPATSLALLCAFCVSVASVVVFIAAKQDPPLVAFGSMG